MKIKFKGENIKCIQSIFIDIIVVNSSLMNK